MALPSFVIATEQNTLEAEQARVRLLLSFCGEGRCHIVLGAGGSASPRSSSWGHQSFAWDDYIVLFPALLLKMPLSLLTMSIAQD